MLEELDHHHYRNDCANIGINMLAAHVLTFASICFRYFDIFSLQMKQNKLKTRNANSSWINAKGAFNGSFLLGCLFHSFNSADQLEVAISVS